MDFITKPICSLYLQHLSLDSSSIFAPEIEDTELTSAATWNSLWRSLMHSSWWQEWLPICDSGNKYRLPTEEQSSGRGSNWRTDSSFHFDFLYFLMWAAMELMISTLLLFCPKYSTNSPSGPTRYMMMVWSTWGRQEVEFRAPHCRDNGTKRVATHDVVVVFVLWSLTVINSVGSGNLLDLSRCPRQADQLWGKLCRNKLYN